ncbi:MAG TPA: hypothetical protein VIH42_11335 [Thermoguttaceae bacterium]
MASSSKKAGQKSVWPILIGGLVSPLAGLVFIFVIDSQYSKPFEIFQQMITDQNFRKTFIFLILLQILLGAFNGKIARERAKTKRRAISDAAIVGGIFGLLLGLCGYISWAVSTISSFNY